MAAQCIKHRRVAHEARKSLAKEGIRDTFAYQVLNFQRGWWNFCVEFWLSFVDIRNSGKPDYITDLPER